MPAEESCSACGAPITVADWMTAVPVTRDGARAHLGCLENPGLPCRAGAVYLLAPRTLSAYWLQPGAWFGYLLLDYVLIECPTWTVVAAQRQLLASLGIRYRGPFENPTRAIAVAEGAPEFAPGIESPWEDDRRPFDRLWLLQSGP